MEIRPFEKRYIADAAYLFYQNYSRMLASVPELPGRILSSGIIEAKLEAMIEKAPAFVSFEGSRMAGYMGGFMVPELKGNCFSTYVPEWGHAAIAEQQAGIYERLYTCIGNEWIRLGAFQHVVTILTDQTTALNTFYQQGFGLHVEDAVRAVDALIPLDEAVEIVRAQRSDIDQLMALEGQFEHYMHAAPIFLVCESRSRSEWEEWLEKPDNCAWVARQDDKLLGYLLMERDAIDKSFILRDEMTAGITGAFVLPSSRGKGLMKALLAYGIRRYMERGFIRCAVDYETQNVLGAQFWRRYFKPVCQSIIRRVDERITRYQ